MKKGMLLFTAIAGTFMSGWFAGEKCAGEKCAGLPPARETEETAVTAEERPGAWKLFIEALMQVESGGREDAAGRDGGVGVLQIRPCMVEEANRLLGAEEYGLDDRLSREKSVEMWSVVQGHYNPSRDVIKALKVHNPNAPKRYVEKVLNEFYKQVR